MSSSEKPSTTAAMMVAKSGSARMKRSMRFRMLPANRWASVASTRSIAPSTAAAKIPAISTRFAVMPPNRPGPILLQDIMRLDDAAFVVPHRNPLARRAQGGLDLLIDPEDGRGDFLHGPRHLLRGLGHPLVVRHHDPRDFGDGRGRALDGLGQLLHVLRGHLPNGGPGPIVAHPSTSLPTRLRLGLSPKRQSRRAWSATRPSPVFAEGGGLRLPD